MGWIQLLEVKLDEQWPQMGIIQHLMQIEEQEEESGVRKMKERSIPEKLRVAGFVVNTARGQAEVIKQEDRDEAMSIVQRYHNTVFLPGIGCIKTDPIKFEIDKDFKPTQPHRRGIPYHYSTVLNSQRIRCYTLIRPCDYFFSESRCPSLVINFKFSPI